MVAADPAQQRLPVHRRKREDTAEGCRGLAQDDLERAAGVPNHHMRHSLERSADAWSARARLLDRLEASFNARAETYAREHSALPFERKI